MAREYSSELYQYIGKVELCAFESRNSLYPFRVFTKALRDLPQVGLSPEEFRLAKEILSEKVKDTKPWDFDYFSELVREPV